MLQPGEAVACIHLTTAGLRVLAQMQVRSLERLPATRKAHMWLHCTLEILTLTLKPVLSSGLLLSVLAGMQVRGYGTLT